MADLARESALKILNTLDKKNLTLDSVLDDFTQKGTHLDRRDLSFVNALVYGVLRWRATIDFIIDHFSKSPLKKIHPEVLNILRLGIFQIKFMSKIPAPAAVNTSVELAKKKAPVWVVKFVNGLLRNVVRNIDNIPFPEPEANLTFSIATEKSFPTWLVQRWLNRFGKEETERLCDTINSIPEITLRTNTLKTDRDSLLESVENEVKSSALTGFSPFGLSITSPEKSISELKPFKDGWFQVQDEAAQIVSMLLDPKPGERVLDACAGLGGKTGHIAQLMENQGEIVAIDNNKRKLKCLQDEMQRLGISIVTTAMADLNTELKEGELGLFDKILVDAPCSGIGVLRRNPDSKWVLTKKNLNRYRKRQVLFLNTIKPLLKPGGIIVYAVCSTEPEEGRGVIDSFLSSSSDFSILNDTCRFETLEKLRDTSGCISTLPHLHNMDGFFSAGLKKAI